MRVVVSVVVTAALLVLTGCASSVSPAAPPSEVALPDTAAGRMAGWVLEVMNADADSTVQQWEGRMHPDFRAEVSADEVTELINTRIRPARPLVATAYRGAEREAVITVEGRRGEPFDMSVVVDAEDRITGLLLAPAAPPRESAGTVDEVAERLQTLPGEVRALVLEDGRPLIEHEPDTSAPLGSVFKLYVLGAVADAVAAGRLTWEEALTVTDDVRSLPSGELQDAPPGTTVTVAEAARKMIAISDNTATDLLIGAVGRDAVEDAVAAMGHHDPAALRPFPTTREFFALLWGGHAELVAAWAGGDEQARRDVLAELADRPFRVDVADADDTPRWGQGLEWFATARDVAHAHEALAERATADSNVAAVLTENPGLPLDAGTWTGIAFKGGSSPGVLAGSWRAQHTDGRVLTVVVLASDPDSPVSAETQSELFGLVTDLFALRG
ncbi:serine hydrolase [Microbacterium caowuchunii]|uniref:serine hydrolase n=1 Tax=Microbacterium caowuchunii TaxID=2614638 RepID=UPI001248B9D0|nr:serine hydrolase [Microbacterium caowuchunii]QEW00413.1 serine hydrolase [Microbacterium caowuchunii]